MMCSLVVLPITGKRARASAAGGAVDLDRLVVDVEGEGHGVGISIRDGCPLSAEIMANPSTCSKCLRLLLSSVRP